MQACAGAGLRRRPIVPLRGQSGWKAATGPAPAAVRKGIDMVLANFDAWLDRTLRNHEKLRRFVWFAIIYAASVVIFGIIAFGLQALVPA